MSRIAVDRFLLACGVAGPAVFVLTMLIEPLGRPGYDPLRHPVSSIPLGPGGGVQTVNFLVTGALVVLLALGLRRRGNGRWLPVLLALVGLGLVGAGLATADPLNGYPPGTPLVPVERTVHGVLHDLTSTPVFTALPAACFVWGRRLARAGRRRAASWAVLAGVAMLACFVLTSLGFQQVAPLAGVAGLLQRTTLVIGLAAMAALAVDALRATVSDVRAPAQSLRAGRRTAGR
jgi:hypothetical membrane protein